MCGIAGYTGSTLPGLVQAMADRITARGPDDQGYFENGRVSLGMRRLSIIDLDTGRQPIANEDETIWTVFNGEIYNFKSLREGLAARGHRFRTSTDTEVLVHLYEEDPLEFVHNLNGMFAIALWDEKRGRLTLVRDRLGIKPLYYAQIGGELVFGSEIKAILAHPDYDPELDPESLHHYLSLKNVPAPRTIFRGIFSLRPGEMAIFERGRLTLRTYWRITYREDPDISEGEAAGKLRELLEDSVRLRLVSDVPVGAYLSGGLDSSSVVAFMRRHTRGEIKTFSLCYEDGFRNKDSDRAFARQISQQFGTTHYEHVMSAREMVEKLPEVVDAFSEPFAGVISTFFLSQLIKQHVKVALSGDGADEFFGSYLAHRMSQPIAHYLKLGRPQAASALTAADRAILGSYSNRLQELGRIADERPWIWRSGLAVFSEDEKRALYSDAFRGAVNGTSTVDLYRGYFEQATAKDLLNQVLEVDEKFLLPDQVLAFVDRLSMAHSIEVRPPFLDYRFVEFAATLPGHMKIRNGTTKHILKKAMEGILPDAVIRRPKEGFVLPVNDWMVSHLSGFVRETLAPERLEAHGLFQVEAVEALLRAQYEEKRDVRVKLWTLVMFQLWYERYFGQKHAYHPAGAGQAS